MSEDFSVRMTLLDAQLVDRNRLPLGRVDDIELMVPRDGGPPEITRILTGSQALGERLGGVLGDLMSSASTRMRDREDPAGPSFVPASLIVEVIPLLELDAAAEDLHDIAGLERWLAAHFVGRLPGTGDAPQ